MGTRTYRTIFWTLAVAGFLLDQATKYEVFRWLYNPRNEGKYQVVPGVFELLSQFTGEREAASGALASLRTWGGDVLPSVNHGALFGLGREHLALANGLFAGVSILAALAIAYWGSRRITAHDSILSLALGLILGGTLGNLYDRLVFGGVRDFLHFYWFQWPVFNVADCCLVCGAGLLLIQAFCMHQPAGDAATLSAKQVNTDFAEIK
jgi:lipoprotein signal peptidase